MRGYSAKDVVRLRGSVQSSTDWPKRAPKSSAHRRRTAVRELPRALTVQPGGAAGEAGVPAIYLSGRQVAAMPTTRCRCIPTSRCSRVLRADVVERINNALSRADQIQWMEAPGVDYYAPTSPTPKPAWRRLNAYELMRAMMTPGPQACIRGPARRREEMRPHGRQGAGPTQEAVQKLSRTTGGGRRRRADPCCLRAPTRKRQIGHSDIDENDRPFLTGRAHGEGFYRVRNGIEQAIARGIAYAEYADMGVVRDGHAGS